MIGFGFLLELIYTILITYNSVYKLVIMMSILLLFSIIKCVVLEFARFRPDQACTCVFEPDIRGAAEMLGGLFAKILLDAPTYIVWGFIHYAYEKISPLYLLVSDNVLVPAADRIAYASDSASALVVAVSDCVRSVPGQAVAFTVSYGYPHLPSHTDQNVTTVAIVAVSFAYCAFVVSWKRFRDDTFKTRTGKKFHFYKSGCSAPAKGVKIPATIEDFIKYLLGIRSYCSNCSKNKC